MSSNNHGVKGQKLIAGIAGMVVMLVYNVLAWLFKQHPAPEFHLAIAGIVALFFGINTYLTRQGMKLNGKEGAK